MTILNPKRNYLKAVDVKNGDVIEFTSEGEWCETKFTYDDGSLKSQFVIQAKLKGIEKDISLNVTNRSSLIEGWGRDTSKWVGKQATIEKIKVSTNKGLVDSFLLHPQEIINEDLNVPEEKIADWGKDDN